MEDRTAELIAIRDRARKACGLAFGDVQAVNEVPEMVRALGDNRPALGAAWDEVLMFQADCIRDEDTASRISLEPVAMALYALHTAAELVPRSKNLDAFLQLVEMAAKWLTIDAEENSTVGI